MRIRWKSERQRRYVLANVKLPYQRTGWLAKQWFVTPTSNVQVVVRNKHAMPRSCSGEHNSRSIEIAAGNAPTKKQVNCLQSHRDARVLAHH